jgi:hypothetical protein
MLTPEEMRAARLRTLGGDDAASAAADPAASLSTLAVATESAAPASPRIGAAVGLSEAALEELRRLLWARAAPEDDRARWHRQVCCAHALNAPAPMLTTRGQSPLPGGIPRGEGMAAHVLPASLLSGGLQGFVLCTGEPSFGLQQGDGGPCGVLAAVQAEMLRCLLFGATADDPSVTVSCGAKGSQASSGKLTDVTIRSIKLTAVKSVRH